MHPDNSNRKNVENILFRNLKSRIRHSLGDEIQQEIRKQQNDAPHISPEHVIQNVFYKVSCGQTFSHTYDIFVEDVNLILESSDSQSFETAFFGENPLSHSLSSSFSSLNSSSIDFLSFEQLSNLFQTLSHSSPLEQLEALETLCRLSTLEHVTKQSVWPDIHSTLLELMLYSDINFVKEGCVRVFVKMLSSHEPKVVSEGFDGLVDFFSKYLQTDENNPEVPLLKTSFIGQIFVLINRFQCEIPSHWLRYPHKVMEDIVKCSVHILDCDQISKVISFFTHFDIQAAWLKNFMYGSIGRSLLFHAFQEKTHILDMIIKECGQFSSNNSFDFKNCCKNIKVSNAIHRVCFLSHFFKYADGRSLLKGLPNSDNTWIDIFGIVMNCVWKLIKEICADCSKPILQNIPDIFKNLWSEVKESKVIEKLLCIVETPLKEHLNPEISCMFSLCLCEILQHPSIVKYLINAEAQDKKFMTIVMQELLIIINLLNLDNFNSRHILTYNLHLIQHVLLISSATAADSTFIEKMTSCLEVLLNLISKLSYVAINDSSNGNEWKLYNNCFQQALQTCFIFLQKPLGLFLCNESNSYEEFLNLLLDGVKVILQCNDMQCLHYITAFASTLGYNFNIPLTHKHIAKLSEMIWNENSGDAMRCLNNLPENILKNIVPAIVSQHAVVDMCFSGGSTAITISQLMEFVLLYPTARNIYLTYEHTILMLRILSILIYDVHIVCILQSQFEIQRLLTQLMHDYMLEDGNFLIDEISVLLNFCIVKLYFIGGPTECVLPPKELRNIEHNYDWPLLITYPPDPIYYNLQEEDINEKEPNDENGEFEIDLFQFQQLFMEHLKKENDTGHHSTSDFLLQSLNSINMSPKLLRSMSDDDVDYEEYVLDKEVLTGIRLTIGYGHLLKLLTGNSNCERDLSILLQKCQKLLAHYNRSKFDVFVATIFLLFRGSLNESWQFFEKFSRCPNSLFIWKQRNSQFFETQDHSVHFHGALLLEFCNFVIKDSLPTIFSAFQLCDCLPSVMFDYWITQCLWNYLDLTEIGNFVTLIIVFGTEYAVYYFASILKHLKVKVFHESHSYNLISSLKECYLSEYKLSIHMEYIISLAEKYETQSKFFSNI